MPKLLLCLLFILALPLQAATEERDDWAAEFAAQDAVGTIVVFDERAPNQPAWVHNPARAAQRFSPASTFKIPHTLMALDAGAVRDEFEVFP